MPVWESTDHPPAIAGRVDLFPTHVEDPSHEEGIVRGLTFADLPRDAYLTTRVVHTQIAADCRGDCAGVTQFVVTNEHNMIMSRGWAAIYSRTLSALLAEALHGHPPSCAVSFVHVCQYVTDRYTDPSLSARMLTEAKTRARPRPLEMHETGTYSCPCIFCPLLIDECEARCIYVILMHN